MQKVFLIILANFLFFMSANAQSSALPMLTDAVRFPTHTQLNWTAKRPTNATSKFFINGAYINDKQLKLSVEYGGGCASHVFILDVWNAIEESFPPRMETSLRHATEYDNCEQLIKTEIDFDLEPVADYLKQMYNNANSKLLMNIAGYGIVEFEF